MELMIFLFSVFVSNLSLCRSQQEFVMGFQENYQEENGLPEGRLYFVNPLSTSVNVKVVTPLVSFGLNSTLTVAPGSNAFITVPYQVHCNGSGYQDKGIVITSDGDIIVQANSLSVIGSSSWEVPPISKLGKVHVIVTYRYPYEATDQGPYVTMIVATEDRTTVSVQLNGPFDFQLQFNGVNYERGDTIEIQLDKYQIAQIQSFRDSEGDITGSVVISNRPVYVTSGAVRSSVGVFNFTTNLVSYVPPTERNGNDYVFIGAENRTSNILCVLGLENGTTFSILLANGAVAAQGIALSAFQYLKLSLPATSYYHIAADKPIMAAFLAKGIEAESHEMGNPFFVFLDSVQQFRSSDYTFTTMAHSGGSFVNCLQLVAPTSATSGITLDNELVSGDWVLMKSLNVSFLTVTVPEGVHRVRQTAGVPFFVLLYGQRHLDAYGLAVSPTPGMDTFHPFARDVHEALYGIESTVVSEEITTTAIPLTSDQNAGTSTSVPTTNDNVIQTTTEAFQSTATSVDATSRLTSADGLTITGRVTSALESKTFSFTSEEHPIVYKSTETPVSTIETSTTPEIETETALSEAGSTTITAPRDAGVTAPSATTSSDNLTTTMLGLDESVFGKPLQLDEWTFWTECSTTCGDVGIRFRLRICSDLNDTACPLQLHTTKITIGYAIDSGECCRFPCPIDGVYSNWSEWSSCGATCGAGIEQRTRTCTEPLYGGNPCEGPALEFRSCDADDICKATRIAKVFIAPMVDERPSTLTIGGLGIALVMSLLVTALLLDLPTLVKHCKMGIQNIRRFAGRRRRLAQNHVSSR